jgi:membrane-associated protein
MSLSMTFASITRVIDFFTGLADTAASWGYWAIGLVVAGDGVMPFFPGETAIVAGSVLAAEGTLNLWLVILVGWLGAIAGDSTAYWIGRSGKGPIRRRVAKWAGQGTLGAAERMVQRRGPALVFVGRFLPGLRIGVNLSCGAGQMGYGRFVAFNAMGALVWSAQAALLGFFAGKAFASQPWVAFAVAFVITILVAGGIGIVERRRIRRERAAAVKEGVTHEDAGESVLGGRGQSPEAGSGVTLD